MLLLFIATIVYFSLFNRELPDHTLFIVMALVGAPLWLDSAGSSIEFALIVMTQAVLAFGLIVLLQNKLAPVKIELRVAFEPVWMAG